MESCTAVFHAAIVHPLAYRVLEQTAVGASHLLWMEKRHKGVKRLTLELD